MIVGVFSNLNDFPTYDSMKNVKRERCSVMMCLLWSLHVPRHCLTSAAAAGTGGSHLLWCPAASCTRPSSISTSHSCVNHSAFNYCNMGLHTYGME